MGGQVEIQRLLDDHHKSLYSKKEEFELELEKKKQAFEEDLKDQMDVLEKKKNELNCREDQILTRELALERKTENLKEKERNADEKERALEEREEFLKKAEKNLKDEKEQLAVDTEKLLTFKDELESLRSTINAEEKQISKEKESIISLKAEVEQKLDDCRTMKDILTKETEDLRLEKNKFEKETEAVNERRTTLEAEINQLNDEKERFQDWRCIEEEKLRKANLDMTVNIQQELEELSLKKEMLEKENADFACELESKLQREFDQKLQEMENEFERRDIQKAQELEELILKKEMLEKEHAEFASKLENNLQKKFDKELQEMENKFERRDLQKAQQLEELSLKNELLEKKHAAFACEIESKLQRKFDEKLREIEKDFERGDIQKAQELEELRLKKEFLEKEHSDFACELESQLQRKFDEKMRGVENEFERRDIQKVQEIDILQKDLANERENFAKEKENFLAVAEQCKICKDCGFAVTQLAFTELQTPNRTNVAGSQFASSGGHMPLLQRCSMLFDISCGNGARHPIEGQASKSIPFESEASEGETNYSPDGVQSDNKTKGNMVTERLEKTAKETETTFMAGDTSTDGMVGEPNSLSIDIEDEGGLKTPPTKPSDQHQAGRRGRSKPIKRTYSVEAGVEDAEYTIEAISEDGEQQNEGAEPLEHLVDIDEKKQGDLVHGDQMTAGANQQQEFGFVRDDVLEPEKYKVLENVSVRGRHKKHRTSPTTPSTAEKRYNFRPSTIQKSQPRT
ncbi:protein CROWDED NUCLEI 2-like isoform X2 [Iris pallida]|uniref:Protein CROWDED NUCLEI 2-like isoform X2 n=1 Tax=Iris pallida TaxID=29817 RepID=A0AAX6EGW2_IRIPA|nr:protein CROWDED NUCLEI 2-like isoform X2 [Iris pallida]